MTSKLTPNLLIRFGFALLLVTAGTVSYYAGHLRLAKAYLNKSTESSAQDAIPSPVVVAYSANLADFRFDYWGRYWSGLKNWGRLSDQPTEMTWDEGDKLRATIDDEMKKWDSRPIVPELSYLELASILDNAKEYSDATKILKLATPCLVIEIVVMLFYIAPISRATKSWFKGRNTEAAAPPKTIRYFVFTVIEFLLISAIIAQFVLLASDLEKELFQFGYDSVPWTSMALLRVSDFYREVCSSSTIAAIIVGFVIGGVLMVQTRRMRLGGTARLTLIYLVVNILLLADLMWPMARLIQNVSNAK